ncbi:MAG: ABC transporter permease, partial [Dehalococcoidia bacterium]
MIRQLRRMPKIPTFILAVVFISAIIPSFIAPHDPIRGALDDMLRPPFWMDGGSMDYLLGTDRL